MIDEIGIIAEIEKIYKVSLGTSPAVGSLSSFIATGGTALGTNLAASKSILDALGHDGTNDLNSGIMGQLQDYVTDDAASIYGRLGSFTGPVGGAAQDDNVKASLDLAHIDIDTIVASTSIRRVASGSKTLGAGVTKYLSIDSGTNGAEIIGMVIKGVVGADWTLDVYVPTADAVAAPAVGDKRDTNAYIVADAEGGMLSGFAIPYNCFLDFTNDSAGNDDIDDVVIIYRSVSTLTLAWEA